MFFKQLLNEDASLSYLLACGSQGKAIAVDVVAGREDWFVEQAGDLKVAITHVIDTHLHADHYSGGRQLAERAGAAYALHESDVGKTEWPTGVASPHQAWLRTCANMERQIPSYRSDERWFCLRRRDVSQPFRNRF